MVEYTDEIFLEKIKLYRMYMSDSAEHIIIYGQCNKSYYYCIHIINYNFLTFDL